MPNKNELRANGTDILFTIIIIVINMLGRVKLEKIKKGFLK